MKSQGVSGDYIVEFMLWRRVGVWKSFEHDGVKNLTGH